MTRMLDALAKAREEFRPRPQVAWAFVLWDKLQLRQAPHATAVAIDDRHGQALCACGYRGPIRTANAGRFYLRRQVVADELRHVREVSP